MKKFLRSLVIAVSAMMFWGCSNNTENADDKTTIKDIVSNVSDGKEDSKKSDNVKESNDEKTDNNDIINFENIIETQVESDYNPQTTVDLENKEVTFETLSKYSYEFCSGAGGWSTNFYIEKDGFFHGNYHDSDMGDTGEDYPGGIVYYCDFSGHFTNLTKVDDFTYEMNLEDISYKNKVGDEEIEDGIKYIYSDAYGLTGTNKFRVYIPGKPISEIKEDVYFWVKFVNEEESEDADTLSIICIENVEQEEGIYSYERLSASESALDYYNSAKNSYEELITDCQNANTTMEMLDNASDRFKLADDLLNNLWILIKYNTDEAEFEKILNEQREWLKQRDQKADEAADSWEGGSFAPVDFADTKAEMTMERCKELADILTD
ncbi:MAG: lysozyme inhibitor LprI family protein [Lachnospiraceae bacterium]|nr:lysozyme inhibitor LprI family protein [Lachnospiraceae bacterium]